MHPDPAGVDVQTDIGLTHGQLAAMFRKVLGREIVPRTSDQDHRAGLAKESFPIVAIVRLELRQALHHKDQLIEQPATSPIALSIAGTRPIAANSLRKTRTTVCGENKGRSKAVVNSRR